MKKAKMSRTSKFLSEFFKKRPYLFIVFIFSFFVLFIYGSMIRHLPNGYYRLLSDDKTQCVTINLKNPKEPSFSFDKIQSTTSKQIWHLSFENGSYYANSIAFLDKKYRVTLMQKRHDDIKCHFNEELPGIGQKSFYVRPLNSN